MVIYYEAILGINTFIHYAFSTITAKCLKIKIPGFQMLLSIIFINVFFIFYLFYDIKKISILGIIPIGIILFINNWKKMFIGTLIYLSLNVALGGGVGIFYLYSNNIYLLIFVFVFLIFFVIEIFNHYKMKGKIEECFYEASFNQKKIKVFLDTGLKISDDLPYLIVNKKYATQLKKSGFIKIKTVCGFDRKEKFFLKDFMIFHHGKKEIKDVYVIFDDIIYDALMGLDMIGEI